MENADEFVNDRRARVRRMGDNDSELHRMAEWLNRPHVKYFWDPDLPPATAEYVRETYGPDTRPDSAGTACVIEFQGRPVGFIQFYPWSAYPEDVRNLELQRDIGDKTWGIDLFIGEADLVGVGVGSRVVELVCDYLVEQRGASSVLLLTDVENGRAQRAYEKAGFVLVREQLDTDTRNGERVRSFVMKRGTGDR